MQSSNQRKAMDIVFEDEDSEYTDGLDNFTQHIKVMGTGATTIGTGSDLPRARITVSERTRKLLANQRAAPSKRSPSPMDVDSTVLEMRAVQEPGSFSITGQPRAHPMLMATTPTGVSTGATAPAASARVPPTSAFRPAPAVPAKRPTDMHDTPGPGSLPPSPGTLPQPSKRPTRQSSRETTPAKQPDFGTELEPFIIAHDAAAQRLLDEFGLAWGTTYEIARGITTKQWTWSKVTRERLEQLRGPNANAAQRVTAVMNDREVSRLAAAELWAEYDREQDAIVENRGRGLGGMGSWNGKDDWYGGRIQQVGRLVMDKVLTIELEKPEIRRSHRFSRFLGSRRILQVKVSDELLYKYGEKVRERLFSSKFILCGRVFMPFHAKEGSIYLLETNQDYERVSDQQDGDNLRMSLSEFIQWHNPLGLNSGQPISKWSTRWALGLSTSVPTIEFEPQNIIYVDDDIYATPQDWPGKAPADKVMTDGCGFINGAALTQIMRLMKYSSRPTAVQGRIGGAKGMWVLHPDSSEQVSDGPAKIWIRPSQHKIKLRDSSELGKAQRVLDLLAPSRVTGPSRLSAQTLINLSHNGISHDLLKELMAFGLREELQSFIHWNQPHSMVLLWKAVERAGSVVVSRLRRMLMGQARALGLGQLRPVDPQGQESEEEEGDLAHLQPLIDPGHKKSSGQPLTLHETVLELLQSGFNPSQLDILFQKLKSVVSLVLDDYVKKFHIPVRESCEAYIIPDPYGVLKEGQIHFRSSEPFINPSTGEQTDMILGDVLVSRNPTRLPSDVQKVKAVAHEKLSKYVNVIIFPIKGRQSLASFLGGGDYDGDTVMLNWCKPLVEQFKGSPLTASTNLSEFFERKVEHVRDFDKRVSILGTKIAQQALQEVLLLGLAETRVGLYSKFHDVAVYKHGYGSDTAINLAYMFTTCLDASKTGLRVKQKEFHGHREIWGSQKPWYEWKLAQGRERKNSTEKKETILHNPADPPFILDVLVKEGEKLKEEVLKAYEELKPKAYTGKLKDEDLGKPWNAAKARADEASKQHISGFAENMEAIQVHVDKALTAYRKAVVMSINAGSEAASRDNPYDRVASFFSRRPDFSGFVFFSDEDVQILKASYASTLCLSFAFSVAFRDLCVIKARAAGYLPITHQFAQCVSVPNVVSRMLSQILLGDTDL